MNFPTQQFIWLIWLGLVGVAICIALATIADIYNEIIRMKRQRKWKGGGKSGL